MDAKEVQFTEGRRAVDAAEAITAMRSLGGLYKGILAAVRDEAVVMEQVFPSPGPAMAMLTHRIFEQRIQVGLPSTIRFGSTSACRWLVLEKCFQNSWCPPLPEPVALDQCAAWCPFWYALQDTSSVQM